jgi:tRNA-dihydrouridine synthase B
MTLICGNLHRASLGKFGLVCPRIAGAIAFQPAEATVTLAPVFDECVIRGRRLAPARFCAPLASYSHSAFRRLVAELGGCGAVWTEMLAARQVLAENFDTSPWVRRRPQEGFTVFQLMAGAGDPLDRILNRLGEHLVEAVDLNLACDSRLIRSCTAGSALFESLPALREVVGAARRHWPGWLTAKIRLGARRPDWQAGFAERVRLLEDLGVDAVTLHPRFFEDKLKRRARLELIPWAASLTRLPLIANGDLHGPEQVEAQAEVLRPACAIMLGRLAVACPWIFAAWDRPAKVDFPDVWRKMHAYIVEDFAPAVALRRLKMFTKYFAANFVFGHQFHVQVSNATSLDEASNRANDFFARGPATFDHPTITGR